MKKRIWFNRWFRTGVNIIDKIRLFDTEKEYEIFITHHEKDREFIKRADFFSTEEYMTGEKYIEFCIDFCKRNRIDIFIPKYRLDDISRNRDRFEKIDVALMISAEKDVMELVQDKARFYEDVEGCGIVDIPEYYIVKNFEDFIDSYGCVCRKNKKACYKPCVSEGGIGFKIVCEKKELKNESKSFISFEKACSTLKSGNELEALVLMEFLEGPEYSIDCLAYAGKLLAAVPRKKTGWTRTLENNPSLIEISRGIAERYRFSYVFNVQVIYSKNVPYLLEVNPRMSGGIDVSCMSGVNFPYLALDLLVKGTAEVPEPKFGMSFHSDPGGRKKP